jgi:glycosyltransferase involved in cell wall biosynthesis
VEGCLSALARGNGLRVSCYISHPKRNLQALFGGSAANLKRVARWLAGIRRDGYIGWIDHEIMRLGLEENVCWLGPLSALDIVEELRKSSAMVLPTFVESYCVALAEAMIVGVPSAVSYTGGTSFLAKDGESALFFPPGDAAMCAFQLERLITDSHLAEQISDHARESALLRHNVGQIAGQQLLTYQKILETSIKVDPS